MSGLYHVISSFGVKSNRMGDVFNRGALIVGGKSNIRFWFDNWVGMLFRVVSNNESFVKRLLCF